MHATYSEMLETPWNVILQDLEFMELENKYGKKD